MTLKNTSLILPLSLAHIIHLLESNDADCIVYTIDQSRAVRAVRHIPKGMSNYR